MSLHIVESTDTIRLDLFLVKLFPNFSRSYLAKFINDEVVLVNERISKPAYKLQYGDIVSYPEDIGEVPEIKDIELPILYEDDFCIVIDKPARIISHAKGASNYEASVASFIRQRIDPKLQGNRAGIVHRLDRGTSGIMIAAKTAYAQKYLQSQFAKRQVSKSYLALVSGKPQLGEAIIEFPIERNPKKPSTFRIGPNGKSANTYYKIITSYNDLSLLLLKPTTGRTHQLRVHLKAIKHPIVGDIFYGGAISERLWLHAYELNVILPDIGHINFRSEPPKLMLDYVNVSKFDT